jgi:hypothetical protein
MNSVDYASAHTDQADLVILSHVETFRDQQQPATPSAVASLIGGAPVRQISQRLARLHNLGLVESDYPVTTYQVTEMGVELLRRDLLGWTPSEREETRRWMAIAHKVNGSSRLV